MSILKLLFLFLFLWILWLGIKSTLRIREFLLALKSMHNSADSNKYHTTNQVNQELCKCSHCNTFIPKEQAIYNNNKPYCCKEHINAR